MPTLQTVSLASSGSGVSLVAGQAGDSQNAILVLRSLIAGAGITITAGDSNTDIKITATGLPPLTSLITAHVHWVAGGLAPNLLPIFTAAYPLVVTAIIGRVELLSSNAASLMPVKAANGVSIASGLPLATTSFNAAGAAFTTQTLPLVNDLSILRLGVGDSIGITTTGTWAGATGGITIHLAPQV